MALACGLALLGCAEDGSPEHLARAIDLDPGDEGGGGGGGGGGTCGNGVLDPGEACDSGACCSACQFVGAGTICRPLTGPCDVAEKCTGTSASCPTDGYAAAGTICDPWAGSACAGATTSCPTFNTLPAGVTYLSGYAGACPEVQ